MTMIDRPDWQRRLQDKISYTESPESKRMRLRTLELANQAAVPAEKLMADEHWRVYQQMLQGAIEAQRRNRDVLLANLLSDRCASYEAMTTTKRLIAECDASIRAWQAAIELPLQLISNAEIAAAALEQETSRYASDADAK